MMTLKEANVLHDLLADIAHMDDVVRKLPEPQRAVLVTALFLMRQKVQALVDGDVE